MVFGATVSKRNEVEIGKRLENRGVLKENR